MKQLMTQWFAAMVVFALLSGCSVLGGNQVPVPEDIPVTGKIEIDLHRTDQAVAELAAWATELKQYGVIEKGSTTDQRVGRLLERASAMMDDAWRLFELGQVAQAEDVRQSARRTWLEVRSELVQATKESDR